MTVRKGDIKRRIRTTLGDECGAALVEFAIIFPVLIILLFGMIDFGRAFFTRNNLVAAAREGARYGAVLPNACAGAWPDSIRARTSRYVTTIGGRAPTAAQLVVTTPGGCAANVSTNVMVSITGYPFQPITPVFRLINFTAATSITVSATYRWEYSAP